MTKKESNIHELFMIQVLKTADVIRFRLSALLKDYELTMPQYNILRILRGAKGAISLGQVKERMHFDTSDVSRLVDRLVKKGIVARNICPDNRRKLDVCISDEGLNILKELDGKMHENLDGFFKDFYSEAKAKEMTELLSQIKYVKEPVLK